MQSIERGPRVSGVYARIAAGGQTLALLDEQGRTARTLTGGAGLIAATRNSGEGPEWVVTGTDPAGVELAAHAVDEATLRDRFAVALTATGAVLAAPQPGGWLGQCSRRWGALLPAPREPAARRARRAWRRSGHSR